MKDVMTTTSTSVLRDLVLSRRSIRAFRDEPVSPDVIRDLLADALWAPSPHNAQPWRFTVLTGRDDKERLATAMADRLAAELRADGIEAGQIERQTARSQERITGAPVAVLCSLVGDGLVAYPDERRSALEWEMAVQSVGAVLQTLFLSASERGIGSCWMAAPMYCPDVVRRTLSLPETYVPQALALLGYPAGPGKIRPRRPLETVVEFR
jgi:F420 biosynthesis protein FbiB-like protein